MTTVVQLYERRRAADTMVNELRRRRRALTESMQQCVRSNNAQASPSKEELADALSANKRELGEAESDLRRSTLELNEAALRLPNTSHPDAPMGPEENAVVVREQGTLPEWSDGFVPRDHVTLGGKSSVSRTPRRASDPARGPRSGGHGASRTADPRSPAPVAPPPARADFCPPQRA